MNMHAILRLFVVCLLLTFAVQASAEDRVFRYDGPGSGLDYATDVAVASNGDAIVVGGSTGSGTGLDFTVLCVTPACSLRWAYRWNHAGSSKDVARAVAVGPDGNIYAAGFTVNPVPYYDVVVASLTPDGQERWVTIHAGEGGGEDSASAIAIDSAGNIYTAGVGDDIFGENTDFTVLSFEPDSGGLRWVYTTSASYIDEASDVVVGNDSTVFASGQLFGGAKAFTVAAINSSTGVERWLNSQVYGDGGRADGIAAHDGKVYACGYEGHNNWDFTVAAFDADSGSRDWSWRYTVTDQFADRALDIIAGTDGNVYACGRTMDSTGNQFLTVASVSPDGAGRWMYLMGDEPRGFEQAHEIVQRPDGYLYACGWRDPGWPFDGDIAVVICLDTAGQEQWVYRYDAVPESVDVANAIALGPDNRVYSCGWSWGDSTGFDMFLLSLDPNPPGVEERAHGGTQRPGMATVVRGVLMLGAVGSRQQTACRAELLDATGRKALELHSGANDVRGLAPGVYFVRAASRGLSAVGRQKVVLTE
jgi:hypothetical protein